MLTACTTLGPDFTRPEVPWLEEWAARPQDLPAAQEPAAVAQRAETEQWWRNFGDAMLEQLIGEAQRLNPGVRTAGARVLEARAQLASREAPCIRSRSRCPAICCRSTSNAPRDRIRTSRGMAPVSPSLGEFDFWGRFRRGIEAADYNYLASIARYETCRCWWPRRSRVSTPPSAPSSSGCRSPRRMPRCKSASVEITKHLFRSGNDSELDVQQAKALYLGTLATIPELEAALRQAHNALGVLVGRAPGLLPELGAGARRIPRASLEVIVDVPAELLRRRPDVRAAEMQSALIGVSEAELYPSIALLGSVGLSSTSRDWSARTLDWGVGPGLVWTCSTTACCATRCWWRTRASSNSKSSTRIRSCARPARWTMPRSASRATPRQSAARAVRSGGAAPAADRYHPVPRGAGRLPARARLAEDPVQPAGAAGRQPRQRDAEPDCTLHGHGRQLAGRAGHTAARRGDPRHDARAQRVERPAGGAAAGGTHAETQAR